MSSSHQPFFFLVLFAFLHQATSDMICRDTCDPTQSEPSIKFPFRRGDQDIRCGYPGFELSCNNYNQTILSLPHSGSFIVQNIDYLSQTILIKDPNSCFPRRFMESFKLHNTPFEPGDLSLFKFFNCSSNNVPSTPRSRVINCMSGDDFKVVAVPEYWYNESGPLRTSCREFGNNVVVPVLWPSWSQLENGVFLKWNLPVCKLCEEQGRSCGFKNDVMSPILRIGCDNLPSNGFPRSAKYGIIIGVAIPGLLCFIGITCYLCGKARDYYHRRRHPDTEFVTTITPQSVVIITGLDKTTIESFPKTLLDESKRLPKPNDNICSICLCEYQPKEMLRTIPECNHYFHVNCIDEWLKLNATCPVCRNCPEGSATVTPSTSISSSSSSFSLVSP